MNKINRHDFDALVLADSVNAVTGDRLTTLCVTFPRFILAEVNTHRMLCLAGDAELEFDLPAGASSGKGHRRVHRMRLDEFVDKWVSGARRTGANPKREVDVSWVDPDGTYSAPEVTARLGFKHNTTVNTACRKGDIPNAWRDQTSRVWWMFGRDVLAWRESAPAHTRFDMRQKLANMQIRQLDEVTGAIVTSTVRDAIVSGEKEVFEVQAGDYSVAGSADHRVMTLDGWKRIEDIVPGEDHLVVRRCGVREEERRDPLRLKKIGGQWRCQWQRALARELGDASCARCDQRPGTQVHHIVPVYKDPSRAFDRTNVEWVCDDCHDAAHSEQGWQVSQYLYGAVVKVDAVVPRGVEPTFDLEIAGPFPNFLANGVVVHNSRNSASSRAIPVKKRIEMVKEHPFVPLAFGKNRSGMQALEDLDAAHANAAHWSWLTARDHAVDAALVLAELGVHKQHANRLLEPFAWQTAIISATEWQNFFALRCHPDAQPEFQKLAVMMRAAMEASTPEKLQPGQWHLPMLTAEELAEARALESGYPNLPFLVFDRSQEAGRVLRGADVVDAAHAYGNHVKVSAGRCARVSYLTHDGKRDPQADVDLAERLTTSGHMSPLEHPAMACNWEWAPGEYDGEGMPRRRRQLRPQHGNFTGFKQYRKFIAGEAVFQGGSDV